MSLAEFKIEKQRGLTLAAASPVPSLMVIAGPNGSGKSTLLNALREQTGSGPVLYVAPHRTARRTNVQYRYLLGQAISIESIFSSREFPSIDGVQLSTGSRDAWQSDDASSFLKHGLSQIEVDRKEAIAKRYDLDKQILKDSVPDPWAPLRELTSNLLPHLTFDRIDASNRNNLRVLWRTHSKDVIVDYDDLSSGEKSVIQIFYPLLEFRTKQILSSASGSPAATKPRNLTLLVDEPELHLHPNLQVKVLDYFRLLVSRDSLQVIMATHSPTIVEHASFQELYLLRPKEAVEAGANQLVQVATDDQKLEFLRDTFGTTANLTSMQSVVLVEGEDERLGATRVSDRSLYRALHPGFDRVTLMSAGGKADVIRLTKALDSELKGFSTTAKAVGLLDRDLTTTAPPGTYLLPVAMIENFLLDPDVLWATVEPVVGKTNLKSSDDVRIALDEILDSMEGDEVERRVLKGLGSAFFRPTSPLDSVPISAEKHAAELATRFSKESIAPLAAAAKKQVEELRSANKRREEYHGKKVLDQFYKRHLSESGLARNTFAFEAARHARKRASVIDAFNKFFAEALPLIGAPKVVPAVQPMDEVAAAQAVEQETPASAGA